MSESELFERYLAILGVPSRPPGLEYLRELVRAQLLRVPFENVSKLYQKKVLGASMVPSLDEYLGGIEMHHFGGTCYASNPHFAGLLRHLGYRVSLCGADMSRPDLHVVSAVELSGVRYLVDVGYGAPFFAPMSLDDPSTQEVAFGRNRYVLQPKDERGRSRLDHVRDGVRIHGYLVNPEARRIEEFEDLIRDSYDDSAVFMNAVVAQRFFSGRSLRLHNLEVIESTPEGFDVERLANRAELAEVLVGSFDFPRRVVEAAIADVPLDADLYD